MNDMDKLTPLDEMDKYIKAGDLEGAMAYLSKLESCGKDNVIYRAADGLLKTAMSKGLVKEDADDRVFVFGR